MRILALLLPFVFSSGCGLVVSDRIEQHFMEVNDSLEQSIKSNQEEVLPASLATCADAYAKARRLDSAIVDLKDRIELMKEAALAYAPHSTNASDSLFLAEGAGAALYEGMTRFVRDADLCCAADSSRARISELAARLLEEDLEQWHERCFYHMPAAAFTAVLSKMQLDLTKIQKASVLDLAAQCESRQPH